MSKSISFLLGAGFSAPMGYPTGNQLNEKLLNFRSYSARVSPAGELYFSNPDNKDCTIGNPYNDYLQCCLSLVEEYSKHNQFDYEQFFEFLAKKEYLSDSTSTYSHICNSFINDSITIDSISSNIDTIYNQMVSSLLMDSKGKVWYDDMPNHIGKIGIYDGFLKLLSNWSTNSIVHIHTLNHDMLFESFNRTDYISGKICDGFEEIGSDYYGELRTSENRTYHVRLERFTGIYNQNIRLYKLHGSLDYVLYYKTAEDGITLVPDKYVKTRYGIGYGNILRDTHNRNTYEKYPFAYHANYLTGTSSKISKYEDPLLFKPLFDSFKNNMQTSELLIIIGYGFKDSGINDIIKNNFRGKRIYIVDPYAQNNENIQHFAMEVDAILIKKSVESIDRHCFV
jgi:hypothetical protein